MAVALAACALGFAGAVARGLARRGALVALCTPGFEEAVLEDLARLPRTRVLRVDRPPDRATGAAVASTVVFVTAASAPQLAGALRHVQELLVLVASTPHQAATAAAFERWAADLTAACWRAAVRRWAGLLGFPLGERLPSFRCEGVRSGAHDFGSQEAAALAADGLERLGCPVRLQDHDLEVRVLVRDGYGLLGLCVGRDQQRSGRKRGGVELLSLGLRPSSGDRHGALRRSYGIRPSTAALLLRLAGAGRGDIVFDPTCGTGAIPIEAASSGDRWALGSDADGSAVEQAAKASPAACAGGWFVGDATRLPLRAGCVDAAVADLPFGRRCGATMSMPVLYEGAVAAAARVLRAGGRLVLLTTKPRLFGASLDTVYWTERRDVAMLVGGMPAVAVCATRSAAPYEHAVSRRAQRRAAAARRRSEREARERAAAHQSGPSAGAIAGALA